MEVVTLDADQVVYSANRPPITGPKPCERAMTVSVIPWYFPLSLRETISDILKKGWA